MTINNPENASFSSLGIAPRILEILDKLKFTKPTPIQYQSIPAGLEGKDLMGVAQTGTGKTLAFGIPMIQKIAQNNNQQGLVILPTRELALQVSESLMQIGKHLGLRTAVLIGGESMPKQWKELRQNPNIVIGTPGRLIDHIEQKTLNLKNVSVLVLDEADRMLDMGFAPQIDKVLKALPVNRQTMLFSATIPQAIVTMATKFMKLPLRVEVAPTGTVAKDVTQELFIVHNDNKLQLLEKLLEEYKGSVIVFSRTKFGVKKIASQIRHMGHSSTEMHSNRSLNQRIDAIKGFKIGRYRILVATDIAARGIDVTGIELVINYDLPEQTEDYIHRIGRTARAGRMGHAISFARPDQGNDVRDIERLIKAKLPVSPLPKLPEKRIMPRLAGLDDRMSSRFTQSRDRRPERRPDNRPDRRPMESGRPDKRPTKLVGGHTSNFRPEKKNSNNQEGAPNQGPTNNFEQRPNQGNNRPPRRNNRKPFNKNFRRPR